MTPTERTANASISPHSSSTPEMRPVRWSLSKTDEAVRFEPSPPSASSQ